MRSAPSPLWILLQVFAVLRLGVGQLPLAFAGQAQQFLGVGCLLGSAHLQDLGEELHGLVGFVARHGGPRLDQQLRGIVRSLARPRQPARQTSADGVAVGGSGILCRQGRFWKNGLAPGAAAVGAGDRR